MKASHKIAITAGSVVGASLLVATLAFAQADTTPPSMPTGLQASTVSSSQIDLSWTASTDNVGVAGYNVFRNGSEIASTTNTTYDDTGLAPDTTYAYTIDAFDAAGNLSTQSASASATTQATSSPTVPTGLAAIPVSSTQVNLSWNASTDTNGTIEGYYVYRNGTEIDSTSATSFSDIGLSPSTGYTYTVASYDNEGDVSAQSSGVGATTLASGTTATSTYTVAPTVSISGNGSILVHGLKVTSVGTDTFTGTVWGITYTVNYTPNSNTGFQFLLRGGTSASWNSSQIQVGDEVGVQGTITQASPNTIQAQTVRNYSITNPRTPGQNNGNGDYGFGNGNSQGSTSNGNGNGQNVQGLPTLLQQLLGRFQNLQVQFGNGKH